MAICSNLRTLSVSIDDQFIEARGAGLLKSPTNHLGVTVANGLS